MTISVMPLKRNNRVCRGLTFLELLFVIVIIGALAMAALASFRKAFEKFQLSSAGSELQSFLIFISQRAVVEAQPVLITFELDSRRCIARIKGTTPIIKAYSFSEGINFETDSQEGKIFAYPDGSLDGVTITLTNKSGQKIKLSTKGVLGGVKIDPL
jgi:prepilin-type N-terminal cleavage/methylation domain-containing protein